MYLLCYCTCPNKCHAPLESRLSSSPLISCVFPLQAMLGSEDCASALLEHGASALCRDSQGRTPLHLVASHGHTELLRTLLKAAVKADPLDSILDFRGYTPTHWAAHYGETSEQTLKQLMQYNQSLIFAIKWSLQLM